MPLVSFLGLVHLWVALPLFVLGGAGSNQGGIDDYVLLHRHPTFGEVVCEGFKDLLAQVTLLQQMAEGLFRVSSGMRSLINAMPAKARVPGVGVNPWGPQPRRSRG